MEPTSEFVVPDGIEPVIGWRAWRIYPDQPKQSNATLWRLYPDHPKQSSAMLCSVNHATWWHGGKPLVAVCLNNSHTPPAQSCSCGIYAAKTRAHLETMVYYKFDLMRGEVPVCMGEVYLWGGVIEGDQGWRAERAYPKTLLVPHQAWHDVKSLRKIYRVPVKLDNTLRNAGPKR